MRDRKGVGYDLESNRADPDPDVDDSLSLEADVPCDAQ
jgi:hypothetical protein